MTPIETYDACIELQRSGKLSEAISALKQLTAEIPDFALAYNALAAIYKKQGNIDTAIQNMEKYCELEPEDSFGFSILSSYCLESGRRDQAEDALGKAHDLRFKAQFG
ncbi:MAG: tetratricopeptide repeat protein [Planctomycetaceae bacterium]|jgi:Flp pilus assembly protein TadD|nr:tetratricopeptide repeat protein [Planctomycetaceae bacterium]